MLSWSMNVVPATVTGSTVSRPGRTTIWKPTSTARSIRRPHTSAATSYRKDTT